MCLPNHLEPIHTFSENIIFCLKLFFHLIFTLIFIPDLNHNSIIIIIIISSFYAIKLYNIMF